MKVNMLLSFFVIFFSLSFIISSVNAQPVVNGGGSYTGECSTDYECGTCGSGACQGYHKCADGVCTSECNTEGNSCGTPYSSDGICYYYLCDSSGTCVEHTDANKMCEDSICSINGWNNYECEKGLLCSDGIDNDGDGQIDACDSSCEGEIICNASTNNEIYILSSAYAGNSIDCNNDCRNRGYYMGLLDSCGGGYGTCVCYKLIECCSDADCPSGSSCVNNFCVKDQVCGEENTPCCPVTPNDCVDYQGNMVQNGECGYPTEESVNQGALWYCDNGKWVSTLCSCLTSSYDSCESLGFDGSCGSCESLPACADPPGSLIGQEFCYKDIYDTPQGPSQECNSGLNCCGDNYCHECCPDSDCSGYDPDTHTKIVCECPDPGCSLTGSSYSCKPKGSCYGNSDCDPNYCCDTITGSRECKSEGTIINYGGKSYLCDPPYGFATGESEIKHTTEEQEVEATNLIDVVFGLLSRIFS